MFAPEHIFYTWKFQVPSIYKSLQVPQDGVLVHGLFIDAGRWDFRSKSLVDANKGEMNPSLPCVHVLPVLSLPVDVQRYVAPLYKTSIRAGVLSTTGHSTNFVMSVLLPTSKKPEYWILKGTALLVQITNWFFCYHFFLFILLYTIIFKQIFFANNRCHNSIS